MMIWSQWLLWTVTQFWELINYTCLQLDLMTFAGPLLCIARLASKTVETVTLHKWSRQSFGFQVLVDLQKSGFLIFGIWADIDPIIHPTTAPICLHVKSKLL